MAASPQDAIGVGADPAIQQIVIAENALALTWQRLNALRQAAYYAGRYDSEEYGRAVAAFRDAERSLRAARGAWSGRLAVAQPLPAQLEPLETPETHRQAA